MALDNLCSRYTVSSKTAHGIASFVFVVIVEWFMLTFVISRKDYVSTLIN